jgi:hypothetical protein
MKALLRHLRGRGAAAALNSEEGGAEALVAEEVRVAHRHIHRFS